MAGAMKKFGQLKQLAAEKAGLAAQKSDRSSEFKQLETITDAKKQAFEYLITEGKHVSGSCAPIFLSVSFRLFTVDDPVSGRNQKNIYASLGTAMVSSGSTMADESPYSEALVKCGETLERIGTSQAELVRLSSLVLPPSIC